MDRKFEEEEEEDLPPGFTSWRLTRRSLKFHASSPNMNCRHSKEKGKQNTAFNPNPTPPSDSIKKTKTRNPEIHHDMPKNPNDIIAKSEPIVVNASDEGTMIAADILSFHGQNGEVHTLSGPPKAPDLTLARTLEIDAPSVVCVKKGLISFIMEAGPDDVGRIITQANNIFAFLQAMNADYGSFYNSVRAYICYCLEWVAAEKELKSSKAFEKVVSHYDLLLHHSKETKEDVMAVEDYLEKAKGYMAPLEARLQDMKEMAEKLELELEERRNDLSNLEAMKAKKMEEIAAVDVELKATGPVAEKTRQLIKDNAARREKARICMEKARNKLRII